MQRSLTSLVLLLALGLSAGQATALGFGKVVGATTLGQPLNFAVALRLESSDSVEIGCIKAVVTTGDHALPASQVRVRLETAAASGERRVRVSSTVAMEEPVVEIRLQLGCPLSLSRNFMVFADPPGRGAEVLASDEATIPDHSGSPVAAVLAAVPPAPQAAASAVAPLRVRKRRTTPEAPARDAVAATAPAAEPLARPVSKARARAAATRSARGPVLRLDPIDADALISPSLQMATSLGQAPASGASGVVPDFVDPDRAQRLRELERLKAMEATLLKLRSDSQATQKSLADMQQRVRAAEAGRYANPVVYLLVLLCVLLSAAVLGLWWMRRRDRQAAVWWKPPTERADVAEAPAPAPVVEELPELPPPAEPPRAPVVAPPAPRPAEHAGGAVVEPRRPMSAEELIDLEQQAEFFVVLGQDDAAIDLLMGHVRSTGGVSPLPYLKLLEIYRRRGEREPYDRIRERFNRRFNAYAPEWELDPEKGLSLEGYPEVMSHLQGAWAAPSQAMELLDQALFRRESGPTFDVPAYRELLFLYSMARDLAEHEVAPEGVDLLLPMSEEVSAPMMTSVEATPSSVQERFSLDLDVSTDHPPLITLDAPDTRR